MKLRKQTEVALGAYNLREQAECWISRSAFLKKDYAESQGSVLVITTLIMMMIVDSLPPKLAELKIPKSGDFLPTGHFFLPYLHTL